MELVRTPRHWTSFLASRGYLFGGCVGQGSFGDVFAVTKTSTGVPLAVKRLVARRKILEDKHVISEIRALVELDHPNIVALEEVLVCDRLACIVMELASEGNIEMYSEKCGNNLSEVFITRAFVQMVSAVQYCHAQELAHRDINPSNFLVFDHNRVKLADFGLCFRCRDITSDVDLLCSDYLGQDAYLAPEVKRKEPYLAKPGDIWSLGCVLYFLLLGTNPCTDEFVFINNMNALAYAKKVKDHTHFKETGISFVAKLCFIHSIERPKASQVLFMWTTW